MMWGRWSLRTIVVGVAVMTFVAFAVLPVAYMAASMLRDVDDASGLLDARQRALLVNTTTLGAGTAALASAVGVPLGLMLARIPLRRTGAVRLALASPLLLPPYVVALAATLMWRGPTSDRIHSLSGAIVVLALVFYPISMLAVEAALRRVDGRLEEAALLVAPPQRVLRHVTLPLVAPATTAAALIIFVLAISEFSVPGLLRVRVYTTEVFTAFSVFYDFSAATLLATPLLIVAIIAACAAAVLFGTLRGPEHRRTGARPMFLDEWRRPAYGVAFAVFAAAVLLPVAILASEASGARSIQGTIAGSADAIGNSLVLSAIAATVGVMLAVWIGYARSRATGTLGLLADAFLVALIAVPGTVVGVGLIGLWNRAGIPGAIYGTNGMFLIAFLARLLPVAALTVAATARHVPVSHEEAAAVSGAGWGRTVTRIVLPQMRLGLVAAWVIVFVLAFGELAASILVAPPGEGTLPIRIYTLIANSPPSEVAMLMLFQTAVILFPVSALALASSVRSRR